MQLAMSLTDKDLLRFQAAHPDSRMELRGGKIIVMSPSDHASEVIVIRLGGRLEAWATERKLGFVAGSNAGFNLPNGDVVAPDVSFVAAERMPTSPRGFASVVPNLVVEVKSPSDSSGELREKLSMLRALGADTAVLIDPDEHTIEIDSEGEPQRTLTDADILEFPQLLPGWSMRVSELWPKPL